MCCGMGRRIRCLIHAVPARSWYVEGFLAPALRRQGADVEIWMDDRGRGNLQACMDAFAARAGSGGTWHLQDDVLPRRDFAARAREIDAGTVACGFCCSAYDARTDLSGPVYAANMWLSFPCIHIPDPMARAWADWMESGQWETEADAAGFSLFEQGRGDDWFFREFAEIRCPEIPYRNLAPNLAEHVDWLIGGSVSSAYRGFYARSALWDDDAALQGLTDWLRRESGKNDFFGG